VIAYAAIRAPSGLSQEVIFEWRHADHLERIVEQIQGGRSTGFRTFSRKRIFPEGAEGSWTVDVLTPDEQLLKRLRFTVEE
jgi:DNA primase